MTISLIIVGVVLAAALIYLASLEGAYEVSRTLKIQAPVDETYRAIVDFKTWPNWSPWLLHEPGAVLQYSTDYRQPGGYYEWDGRLVGAGRLTHLELREKEAIDQGIEFRRPFKSRSRVGWRFKAVDGETEVTWTMSGRMPFFFRFMTRSMKDMIGHDYELGLLLLNGYLNPDSPRPQISFEGEQLLPPFDYLGRSFRGNLDAMVEAMTRGFPELRQQVVDAGLSEGKPCTLYFKVDPAKRYFECDMAVPVATGSRIDGGEVSHFAGGRYHRVLLKGDYEYLELAWYKAYSHVRMLNLKIDGKRPSIEVYENDPELVERKQELLTSIYLPVR